MRRLAAAVLIAAVLGGLPACRQDMHDNPRYEPLEKSDFFRDRRASRLPVEGTVARGGLREDDGIFRGKSGTTPVAEIPLPVTRELLSRGRARYDIFCAPCHDRVGTGLGMVVRRGYRRPPSLHDERLRQAAPGYMYDVITSGFGSMPDYAEQIPPEDRWAIVAYTRALQLSQRASAADVPPEERARLDAPAPLPTPAEKRMMRREAAHP
jgi:mono/diheme cytochrome c family protein